ncbi:hypothetical protein LSAT2_023741 [Lamellibrachia satsuma]|nr:hypothetical protein LSAT2_023741 [Lamellibrachia satsuma]
MCLFQDTLSTPRLSTSSKKRITPGRVQIHRNPFDRFLNSHNGPSQVRTIVKSIPTWAGVLGILTMVRPRNVIRLASVNWRTGLSEYTTGNLPLILAMEDIELESFSDQFSVTHEDIFADFCLEDINIELLLGDPVVWEFTSLLPTIKPLYWHFQSHILPLRSEVRWNFSSQLQQVAPVSWTFEEQIPHLKGAHWNFDKQLAKGVPLHWIFPQQSSVASTIHWNFRRQVNDKTTIIWGFPEQLLTMSQRPLKWNFITQIPTRSTIHWTFPKQITGQRNDQVKWKFPAQLTKQISVRWDFAQQLPECSHINWQFNHIAGSGPIHWNFAKQLIIKDSVKWNFEKFTSAHSQVRWNFEHNLQTKSAGSVPWHFEKNLAHVKKMPWNFPKMCTEITGLQWNFQKLTHIPPKVDFDKDHARRETTEFKEQYTQHYHKPHQAYRDVHDHKKRERRVW